MTGSIYFFTISLFPVLFLSLHFNSRRWSNRLEMAVETEKRVSASIVLEQSRFLDFGIGDEIRSKFGLPLFVYSEQALRTQAQSALSFPHAYGLTVRFAMKACANAAVLKLFRHAGLHFDASSGHEVHRAVRAGVDPRTISISSQEFPEDFSALFRAGIEFNACSLRQLEEFGKLFPGGSCGIRFNPGKGSGGTSKTVSHST